MTSQRNPKFTFMTTYNRSPTATNRQMFDRAMLPPPVVVLQKLGIAKGEINSRGYFVLHCPFHKDGKEIHPSLNLHVQQGNYRCHTCGQKGGDILAFYMAVTGNKFLDAIRALGSMRGAR